MELFKGYQRSMPSPYVYLKSQGAYGSAYHYYRGEITCYCGLVTVSEAYTEHPYLNTMYAFMPHWLACDKAWVGQ